MIRLTPKSYDWKVGCSSGQLVAKQRVGQMSHHTHIAITRFCVIQSLSRVHESSSQLTSQVWKFRPPSHIAPSVKYYTLCTDISLVNMVLSHRAKAESPHFTFPALDSLLQTLQVQKEFYFWAPEVLLAVQTCSISWLNTPAYRGHGNCHKAQCAPVSQTFQWQSLNSSEIWSSALFWSDL